jgi:transposase
VARHLKAGALVLYDLSSSYVTGRHCPLARRGYSRDHRSDLPQITYGVITDAEGRPLAVEVFPGNTRDCTTVMAQVERLRMRYKLRRMVIVGDRGMITDVQIDLLAKYPNIDWISALTNPQVAEIHRSGALQLGLFDERHLVALQADAFPGQRLVACRNRDLAALRATTREALLQRTEARLQRIEASVVAGRLRGADKIGERVGRAWKSDHMRKHFVVEISDASFGWYRDKESIASESALDGIYVVRTSLQESPEWSAEGVVRAYKRLADVERVLRTMKTTELLVRPIFHRTEDRVRSHIFLCLLAAHVGWELEHRLAPFLYVDEGLDAQHATRDPVEPPVPSKEGRRKKKEHVTLEGDALHSLPTLLKSMGFLARVSLRLGGGTATFDRDAIPTSWQRKILAAGGVAA